MLQLRVCRTFWLVFAVGCASAAQPSPKKELAKAPAADKIPETEGEVGAESAKAPRLVQRGGASKAEPKKKKPAASPSGERAKLSDDKVAEAEAVKKALTANPKDAEARKKFDAMLAAAKQAAKKGASSEAGQGLLQATLASGAPDEIYERVSVGVKHLELGNAAQAQTAFEEARSQAEGSEVLSLAVKMASTQRKADESKALAALGTDADPRPHAQVLRAGKAIEPKSRNVSRGLKVLLTRAEKSAAKGEAEVAAWSLEAAAGLAADEAEFSVAVQEAAKKLSEGKITEAEKAFSGMMSGDAEASSVLELGAKIARRLRVDRLKASYKEAKTGKDPLTQSRILTEILALAPNDRMAKSESRRIGAAVLKARLKSAETEKAAGRLGVAYLYFKRASDLDPKNSKARSAMKAIESELKKRGDLILVVERMRRAPGISMTDCKNIETPFRKNFMTIASERTDLGAYVLSPDWTKLYEAKDERAPNVSGGIQVEITGCKNTYNTGKVSLNWSIVVPREGAAAAKGTLELDLPRGTLLRDEQDSKGENIKNAMAEKAATALTERIFESRDQTEQWLLTLAEHAMNSKDGALAADAVALLAIKGSASADPKRLHKVTDYLDGEFR